MLPRPLIEGIFTGLIQNKIFNYSFEYFVGQNWKFFYQLWLNQAPLLILCLCNWGGVYGRRSPRVKEVEGFKLQVINNSNIVVCVYHKPFQESYLVSQESYLVGDVQLCIILYVNIRVGKCHGYDGYIRVKKLASWGKKVGRLK